MPIQVGLYVGKNFGAPSRYYFASTSKVDDDVYQKSNSLAVYLPTKCIFYSGDNYQGDPALVIALGGSLPDLSNTPWGNWANRIASVRFLNSADELLTIKSESPGIEFIHVNRILDPMPEGGSVMLEAVSNDPRQYLQFKKDGSVAQCGGGGYMNIFNSHPSRTIVATVNTTPAGGSSWNQDYRVAPGGWVGLGCTDTQGGDSWIYSLVSARFL
jgi:hypothetical protein